VINRLITGLQWEEHQVLAMPFDRARSLLAYWGRRPPVNEMLEMYVESQTNWRRGERSRVAGQGRPMAEDLQLWASAFGVPLDIRKQ
jgi:hypothetical protein